MDSSLSSICYQSSICVSPSLLHRPYNFIKSVFWGIFDVSRRYSYGTSYSSYRKRLHVDCHSDNNVKNFAEILQTYGLQQHIQVPTHESGNTLDLIIPRSNSDITISSPRAAVALSDHFFIEWNLNIPRPNSTVKEIFYRKHWISMPLKPISQNLCFVHLRGKTSLSWPSATTAQSYLCLISMPFYWGKSR